MSNVRIAYVRWLDARGHSGARPLAVAKKMGGLVLESAGILISQDKEAVRIAQDIYTYDEEEGETVRDIEAIPTKYVLSKKIFEVKGEK